MNFFSIAYLLLSVFFSYSYSYSAVTDWSQPPIECVEEIVPKVPNEPCLDLTQVENPIKDFPTHFSEEEIAEWKRKRRVLTYCRYEEVKRRERLNPGSQSPDALKVAWMLESANENRDSKIAAVYKASRDYKMPFTILAGAIRQESLFAALGISPDGNNYSCGIGQFNIVSWCNWVNLQSNEFKKQTGWPQNFSCNELNAPIVKPFYDIAIKKLGSIPLYKLGWDQFKDIQYNQVSHQLGSGSQTQLAARYQATMSFAKNCINPIYAIQAKGNEIAQIYNQFIPNGLKQVQHYGPNQKWPVQCREKGYEAAYPFHAGWLLAVGMYNAGPRILNSLSYYWGWNNNNLNNPNVFTNINATELVEGLYWGGKYDASTDEVVYRSLNGSVGRTSWYKMCVVQRHVARIVQHSTKLGYDALVDSLEGASVCAPAKRDPNTGKIITSAPIERQNSSGVKF